MIKQESELGPLIQEIMIEVCSVLYHHGYHQVSVGAVMRLLGIPDDKAHVHDNEFIELNDDFEELLNLRKQSQPETQSIPEGTTIH